RDRGAGRTGTRGARRHSGRGAGGRAGRKHARAVRPDRHPGQQRGRPVRRTGRADHRKGLARSAPPRRRRGVGGNPRSGGQGDDPATLGRDVLHGVLTAAWHGLDGARRLRSRCAGESGRRARPGMEPVRVRTMCIAAGTISTEAMLWSYPEEDRARWQAEVPLRRFGTPDEVSGLIAFLASPAGAYVTGTTIVVDGGADAWGNGYPSPPLVTTKGTVD